MSNKRKAVISLVITFAIIIGISAYFNITHSSKITPVYDTHEATDVVRGHGIILETGKKVFIPNDATFAFTTTQEGDEYDPSLATRPNPPSTSEYIDLFNKLEWREQECNKHFKLTTDHAAMINPWNMQSDDSASLKYHFYDDKDAQCTYGIITNESDDRIALVSIDIWEPDEIEMNALIGDLDYTNDYTNDMPHGYVSTWDGYVILNPDTFVTDIVNGEVKNHPNRQEFVSLSSYAYALGIDLDESLNTYSEVKECYDNLAMAEEYGIRGYSEYSKYNDAAIQINSYSELQEYLAVSAGPSDASNEDNGIDIYTFGSGSQTITSYPPKVNQYIDYGYEFYLMNFGGAVAYYYKDGDRRYVRFCIDGGDIATDAWSEKVAQPIYTDDLLLTRIS